MAEEVLEMVPQAHSAYVPRPGWLRIPATAYSDYSDGTTVELPDDLESAACLEFLGLAPAAAKRVYERFVRGRRDHGDPADIVTYAEAEIRRGARNIGAHSLQPQTVAAWDEALQAMGVGRATEPARCGARFRRRAATCNGAALGAQHHAHDVLVSLLPQSTHPRP